MQTNQPQHDVCIIGHVGPPSDSVVSASVILPVNKDNPYLDDAIRSVLNQDHRHLELLVIVDGPTSEFAQALKRRHDDERLQVLYTAIPGLPFALNLGVAFAKAPIVFRMDGDDLCESNRVSTMLNYFSERPETTVLASTFKIIDDHGKYLRESKHRNKSPQQVRRFLACRCIIGHPTVAFRRDAIIEAGAYAYGSFSEDYDLWLRLRRNDHHVFAMVNTPLLRYRVHANQSSSGDNATKILAYDASLKLRELIFTKDPIYFLGIIFSIMEYLYKKIYMLRFIVNKFLPS